MLEPLNTTSNELDPVTREYRVSFLKAIEKFIPSVLRDLEIIFGKRFSDPDLERALRKWAQHHRLYSWVLKIARTTMDYWERQPKMSRTTWKLPPVQMAAVWEDERFSFRHRGYQLHIDGYDLRVYAETVRGDFERTLPIHISQLQNAKDEFLSKQSGQAMHKVQKRSRDGRDKLIGFAWLAMSLAGTSLAMIATEAKVDRAAVVKQIKWANSVLSVE
jgi:hypothetical protein